MAKRGPKPRWFELDDNTKVNGLVRSGQRWKAYLSDGSMREFREADPHRAVIRFRQMEAMARGRADITLAAKPIRRTARPVRRMFDVPENVLEQQHVIRDGNRIVTADRLHEVVKAADDQIVLMPVKGESEPVRVDPVTFWRHVADELHRRAQWCADISGIEWLAYGPTIKKPQPSPALEEVGNVYFERTDISPKEISKARTYWEELKQITSAKTLRDLTVEVVASYGQRVNSLKLSAKSRYHRFNKVKTVLNYYRTTGKALDEVRKALDSFAVIRTPETTSLDPHPISREDWDALYAAVADQPERKAMLLVALNLCMYPVDLARLQWSELDLSRATYSANRGKTKVAKVAVLWPETIGVLKQLTRQDDGYVFHKLDGRPHTDTTIRKWFYALRDELKMDKSVQMGDLRDGAFTEAVQGQGVQFQHAQIIAGHRSGMADHYVRRNPKMVEDACRAVRNAYLESTPNSR